MLFNCKNVTLGHWFKSEVFEEVKCLLFVLGKSGSMFEVL